MRAAARGWLDREAPLGGALPACLALGCGNSGGTLVASRLGLRPRVFTIPEEPTRVRPHRRLTHARERLLAWMEAARAAGAMHPVEKTPGHLQPVGRIRRLLPEARILRVRYEALTAAAEAQFGGRIHSRTARRWEALGEDPQTREWRLLSAAG